MECGHRTYVLYPSPVRRGRMWPKKTLQCIGRMTTTYWSLRGKQIDEDISCGLPIDRPGVATLAGRYEAEMEELECFTWGLRARTSKCKDTP